MKIINLMRHGKSSWEYDVSDQKRPLKTRGRNDAELIANQFVKSSELPQKIFSSPAKRALDTCKIAMNIFGLPENTIKIEQDLYDFGGERVIRFIKNLPNDINNVMLFGHNHAFTSITNIFGSKYIDNLPTSGLAKISFDIDEWKDLKEGITEFIIIPKELKL